MAILQNNCSLLSKSLFSPIKLLTYTSHPVSVKYIMQMSFVLQAQSTNGIHFRHQRNLAMSKWWENIWPRGWIALTVHDRCFFQMPIFSFTPLYKSDWWNHLLKRWWKSNLFDIFLSFTFWKYLRFSLLPFVFVLFCFFKLQASF